MNERDCPPLSTMDSIHLERQPSCSAQEWLNRTQASQSLRSTGDFQHGVLTSGRKQKSGDHSVGKAPTPGITLVPDPILPMRADEPFVHTTSPKVAWLVLAGQRDAGAIHSRYH